MSDPSDLVRVSLIGVPVQIWKQASAHQDALQREFDIIIAGSNDDSVPRQLLELIRSLDARFGGIADDTWNELYDAAETDRVEIDLVFNVPAAAASASRELASMLDRVDDYCRAGETLLSLATPPDLVAFRRWFLSEFTRQIEGGAPPRSWTVYTNAALEAELVSAQSSVVHGEQTIVFEGELDLMTAGELRERILAKRAETGPSVLVLDMRGLTFVDSVGVSLLVSTYVRLVEDGAQLRLILPERTRPVIEISGLLEVLDPQFASEVSN